MPFSKQLLCFLGFRQVMRDTLQYRPQLTKDQFLSPGFAERKVMMMYDLLQLCQSMHRQLQDAKTSHKRKETSRKQSSLLQNHTSKLHHTVDILEVTPKNTLVIEETGPTILSPPPSPLKIPVPIVPHDCSLPRGSTELLVTPISTPPRSMVEPTADPHHNSVLVHVVREPVCAGHNGISMRANGNSSSLHCSSLQPAASPEPVGEYPLLLLARKLTFYITTHGGHVLYGILIIVCISAENGVCNTCTNERQ